MGLDAVVFRSVHHLEREFGTGLFEVDNATGESALKPGLNSRVPRDKIFAIRRRLGNAAEVGGLRNIVEKLIANKDSIIGMRVLYSGTHSGDVIGLNEFPILEREIEFLRSLQVAELVLFIEAMESLLAAALAERNPIVFV